MQGSYLSLAMNKAGGRPIVDFEMAMADDGIDGDAGAGGDMLCPLPLFLVDYLDCNR